MRTATGLTLIAIGAILGLAVNASTPGINLHIVGLIIALTGVAGLLLRSRTTGWLRRRVVLHGNFADPGPQPEHGDDQQTPAYLVEDPAVLAAEVLSSAQLAEMARRDEHDEAGHAPRGQAQEQHPGDGHAADGPAAGGHPSGGPAGHASDGHANEGRTADGPSAAEQGERGGRPG